MQPTEQDYNLRDSYEEDRGTVVNTTVVHVKRTKCDVYVGRPSKWGNPFVIGKDGTREEVIAKYEAWLATQPQLMMALGELKGQALGCWCHPLPCHADVLARLADACLR